MSAEQTTENTTADCLVERAGELRKDGWRLCAISSAKKNDAIELLYSFDKAYTLLNLRLEVSGPAPAVPSISSHYFCAVLYENEMHDLFGLQVNGMAVDFKGNLYRTAVKFPFGSTKAPEAKPPAEVVRR
jgi:ech hydrogenase subunit D